MNPIEPASVSDGWDTFLRQQGAVIAHGEVIHFGDPAAERRAARDADVLVDLSPLSLIRVRGADATTFLNAQLTNDVVTLAAGQSQLAAWCSPKGRMLALPRVIRHADEGYEGYLLQLPRALRDDIIKQLRVYVLRAKVVLENADGDWCRIGVSGPSAAVLVQQAANLPGAVALRLPGVHPRFEILTAAAGAPALWERLRPAAAPAGWGVWEWLDIMAGIPTVSPATRDAFVPQMANLDLIGGVSFNKGCYPGQEIVARVHYRGRIKERMFRAHLDTAATPRPGEPIYAPDLPGQAAGSVVAAQPSPHGGYDLLAVIRLSSAKTADLHWREANGPRLSIGTLPYAVE